jgi:hypothetical protein
MGQFRVQSSVGSGKKSPSAGEPASLCIIGTVQSLQDGNIEDSGAYPAALVFDGRVIHFLEPQMANTRRPSDNITLCGAFLHLGMLNEREVIAIANIL